MKPETVVRGEVQPGVWQSRHGYYSASYQTFLQLRQLRKAYWRAVRQVAAWRRWQRKDPKNRVVREWHRNALGQKVGFTVVGPRPEPPLCPLFTEKKQVDVMQAGVDGYRGKMVPADVVTLMGPLGWRIQACLLCCKPVASPADVRPLPLTAAQIADLVAKLGLPAPPSVG